VHETILASVETYAEEAPSATGRGGIHAAALIRHADALARMADEKSSEFLF
jgi:hypothetical protein